MELTQTCCWCCSIMLCGLTQVEPTIAGQFFQNTNWLMTSVVLAWVVVTIGYIVVRATQSLNFADNSGGLIVYGIVVLTVEVSPRHPQLLFTQPHVRAAV